MKCAKVYQTLKIVEYFDVAAKPFSHPITREATLFWEIVESCLCWDGLRLAEIAGNPVALSSTEDLKKLLTTGYPFHL